MKWTTQMKRVQEALDKFKPVDRLGYVSAITAYNVALQHSVSGWQQWLTDARIMSCISMEDLQCITQVFQETVMRFLSFDIEIMEKYMPASQKKVKKKMDRDYLA